MYESFIIYIVKFYPFIYIRHRYLQTRTYLGDFLIKKREGFSISLHASGDDSLLNLMVERL